MADEQESRYPAPDSESSLRLFLEAEKDGKAEIHSTYDNEGTLCLSFVFDDDEAEFLTDLVVDCMSLLIQEVRQRHEQEYEGLSTAEALKKAAEDEDDKEG